MVMMVFLVSDLVHVLTFSLDPFVDSIKRGTVEVGFGSIVVVVVTFVRVESFLGVGNLSIFLGFGFISGVSGLSTFFVLNGLICCDSKFTSFLFSLGNSVIIILLSLTSLSHHWRIGNFHGCLISSNLSFSHDFTNWSCSWLWENDFLIDTAENASIDELDMSICGMVETIEMSMGVRDSLLVSLN